VIELDFRKDWFPPFIILIYSTTSESRRWQLGRSSYHNVQIRQSMTTSNRHSPSSETFWSQETCSGFLQFRTVFLLQEKTSAFSIYTYHGLSSSSCNPCEQLYVICDLSKNCDRRSPVVLSSNRRWQWYQSVNDGGQLHGGECGRKGKCKYRSSRAWKEGSYNILYAL